MRKKFFQRTALLSLTVFMLGTVATFASGKVGSSKEQYYKGIVKAWQANATLDTAYRDTEHTSDPFYVRLETNTEGKGTVMRFWLEDAKGNNLSDSIEVTQGKGDYKQNTYKTACKTRVYLTAENNNFSSKINTITGYWKEE